LLAHASERYAAMMRVERCCQRVAALLQLLLRRLLRVRLQRHYVAVCCWRTAAAALLRYVAMSLRRCRCCAACRQPLLLLPLRSLWLFA